MVYGFYAVNLLILFLEAGGPLICLWIDLNVYHLLGQNMLGQLHFGELAFTNRVKDRIVLNSGLGHEVLHP